MIPYGRQKISNQDVEAVVAVLRSDFLTQGPKVPEFEAALCKLTGAKHAVAMNSATSALHAACLALGLGPGDRLWTTPITFVASANCGIYCGATVDFVDIDTETFNLCTTSLEQKLIAAAKNNTLPKILIPVHFGGNPCNMTKIKQLSLTYGFRIIEDASHAIGAQHHRSKIGSGAYSDITIFSFHPVKIITSGEGGAALTNDHEIAGKLEALRSHGISRDPAVFKNDINEPWYYEQSTLGFNFRMNDIEAALGLSQLDSLESFSFRRRQIAKTYQERLAHLPVAEQLVCEQDESGWHLYVIRLLHLDSQQRNTLFRSMRTAGIGVNLHYIPVHLQPFYQDQGFKLGDLPRAESYFNQCITLPLHPSLLETEIEAIASNLERFLK